MVTKEEAEPMLRHERRGAMGYARDCIRGAAHPELSPLSAVGLAYNGSLAAARAVCDRADYMERGDLEALLEAARTLTLDDVWCSEAPIQAEHHSEDALLHRLKIPNEADVRRTVRWAETLYRAAEAHIQSADPDLIE